MKNVESARFSIFKPFHVTRMVNTCKEFRAARHELRVLTKNDQTIKHDHFTATEEGTSPTSKPFNLRIASICFPSVLTCIALR